MSEHVESREVIIRPIAKPGDWGWIIMQHGEIYTSVYGWSSEFEIITAQVVTEFASRTSSDREAGWIAEVHGERVGCVICVANGEGTARLRLLLVLPSARGLGAGSKLVHKCVEFARQTGYSKLSLWTVDVLESARKIYRAEGFDLIKKEKTVVFGKEMTGESWSLIL